MDENEDNEYHDSSLTSALLNNEKNIDDKKEKCNDSVVLPEALTRDIIGFGLLGSMNGILLAMYFTGTYLSFLNIPDDNIGTLVLSGSIGAAVGSALCAVFMPPHWPRKAILHNTSLFIHIIIIARSTH